jgi:hypothetical protein
VIGLPVLGTANTLKGLGRLPVKASESVDIPGYVPKLVSVLIESEAAFNDISEAANENSGLCTELTQKSFLPLSIWWTPQRGH